MYQITITEEEARELQDLIGEELGDPLVGRNERLIRRVSKKIAGSQLRIIGECGRSGAKIFLNEKGEPEACTFKCDNPKCGHTWKSWYVETSCPKCQKK